MHYSHTFYFYLVRKFAMNMGLILLAFLALAYIIEFVELLRRTDGNAGVNSGLLIEMAALRLPLLSAKLIPFAVLLGAVATFANLTRSNELIVARTAGLSVWQFMLPAMTVAILSGILMITTVSPFGSATTSRYQELEAKNLTGLSSVLAVSPTGLWLRQANDTGGQSVIHALRVSNQGTLLHDVIIFANTEDDQFLYRIDAETAELKNGFWDLTEGRFTEPDRTEEPFQTFELPTSLTLKEIQNSFAPPETLSFWALPEFIESLEEAGFNAVRHRLHWHTSLALPFVLGSMVLLAACFSLRLTRRGGTALLGVVGVMTGFVFYFISDIVIALGQSGAVPPELAAWAPGLIVAMIGTSLLLHLEDG